MEGYDYSVCHCVSHCVSHFNAYEYCEALHEMRFPDDWTQPPWKDFDEWRRIHRCWFTADEKIGNYDRKVARGKKKQDAVLPSQFLPKKACNRCDKRKQLRLDMVWRQIRKDQEEEARWVHCFLECLMKPLWWNYYVLSLSSRADCIPAFFLCMSRCGSSRIFVEVAVLWLEQYLCCTLS